MMWFEGGQLRAIKNGDPNVPLVSFRYPLDVKKVKLEERRNFNMARRLFTS
jgi:hypothetical protein